MKYNWAGLILRAFGWKVQSLVPPGVKKYVVMMAPHTSNWDFVVGYLSYKSIGIKSKFLIKKEAFYFPLGILLKSLGAIPVDRQSKNNIVMQVGELFRNNSELIVTLTPEGTRSLNPTWKRGFYYIAEYGKVPVALGYLDYKTKRGGIVKMINPTGNYEADLVEIERFYRGIHARYPEKFNLSE